MDKLLNYKKCVFHKYIKPQPKHMDIETFFKLASEKIYQYISKTIQARGCIKSLLTLSTIMRKYTINNEYIYETAFFQSSFFEFKARNQIIHKIPKMMDKIVCAYDCFTREGSGWSLYKIRHLEIKNVQCRKKLQEAKKEVIYLKA